MQISSEIRQNDLFIKLNGSLDVSCQESLKSELSKSSLAASGKLIVDLSAVSFIDSACLGVFVSVLKTLKSVQRELVFVSPQDEVRSIFQITRLDRLFKIVDSIQEV